MSASGAFVVALLGAESTGKTTLAAAIATALKARGERVAVVGEYLREFCDLHGRTPERAEQAAIAAEQTRRIAAATAAGGTIVADTTALMVAVYSDFVFGDSTLYTRAESDQRGVGLSLITTLDLPWEADGLQRTGAHVREPVDALLRASLARAGGRCAHIAGIGPARLEAALAAIDAAR